MTRCPGRSALLALLVTSPFAASPAQAALKALFARLDEQPAVEAGLALELDTFAAHWAAHDVPRELRRFFARRTAG